VNALERLQAKTAVTDEGCWEWRGGRGVDRGGYGHYGRFWFDGRMESTHRVAWLLLVGEIPTGLYVCHACDNPPCWNPAHLFLGTATANVADMMAKGRFRIGRRTPLRGQANGHSRLTDRAAASIPHLLARGHTGKAIAERLGVSTSLISAIRTGRVRHGLQPLFEEVFS